jgi:heme-degrading monooxygenase HmoA
MRSAESPTFVVLSIFTSTPELRQKFVELMREFIDTQVRLQPGAHSVEIFADESGSQIITLARWKDRASFEAFKRSESGQNATAYGLVLQPKVAFLQPEGSFAKE